MLINKTTSYCCDCGDSHEAAIEESDGKIYFKINCPKENKSVKISNNSEIFISIRNKSYSDLSDEYTGFDFSIENFIEVTDDCNFNCPLCYAHLENENKKYLELDDILDCVKILKDKKKFLITLTGGEATLHPDIFKIIKESGKIGVGVKLISNGFIIGKDSSFAEKLKQNRLDHCFIQFDTFDSATHKLLRNNDTINIKKNALENLKKEHLNMGTISVMIKRSLNEIGELIKYFLTFTPELDIITFLSPIKAPGRFELKDEEIVDREDIIKSIIDSEVIKGLNISNFRAFPKFNPFCMDIHPDCAALLLIAVNDGKIEPLDNYINLDKLYKLLGKVKTKNNFILGFLLFGIYLLRSIKLSKWIVCLTMFYGYIFRRGKHTLAMIIIEQFMNDIYQDEKRLAHCITHNILKKGEGVPICIFNHPDKRRSEKTRINLS